MAAAVCLAPQAQAAAPAHVAVRTAVTAEPATVADATYHAGMSTADLLAVVRQSSGHAQKAQPDRYTIRSGDSLSKIAGKVYHKQNAWPVLYWANRDKVQWANIISTGQDPRRARAAGPGAPAPACSGTGRGHVGHVLRAGPGHGRGVGRDVLGRRRVPVVRHCPGIGR
jgi:hypothetical protein